ncbi:MAG TPA: DEAD/DEAH box helicase, partial [Mizugakiibacter sp.]|nr:DEAD/DEAH box helicase [Mizugakiibacter sp.]
MTFESLGLAPVLLRALDALGHHQPTPIQAAAIPQAIQGHDLRAAAQTGTGKTGGFALPLLHRLFTTTETGRRPARHPRALIITPTRELAAQVHEHLRAYAQYLPLRSTTIFGGVGIGNQLKTLARGVDVLVATPGRLLDHLDRGSVNLAYVEILVLD